MQLTTLSKTDLLAHVSKLVAEERRISAELIRHLAEVERRRLHLELGCDSLFAYLVKHHRFSEGAASRRIAAVRLFRDVPDVPQAIASGELSLSTVSQVTNFLKAESKAGKTYTPEQKSELTHAMAGKSKRECEREFLKLQPQSDLPKERTRAITPTHTEIRFVASDERVEKLERLKALLAHHGNLSYAELFERLADQALKKHDPAARATQPKTQPKAAPKPTPPAGSQSVRPVNPRPPIRAEDKRVVWQRAQGRCEFVSPITGRRCGSRWAPEIDHRVPLAQGGAHELANLRLTCRAHNQWLAIQAFGTQKMGVYLRT